MRKRGSVLLMVLLLCLTFMLGGCSLLNDILGVDNSNASQKFEEELERATGKWQLVDDEDTYFEFDGTRGAMKFNYVEDGRDKYNGSFRVIHRGNGKDVVTPLGLLLTRTDKEKEDWLDCYVDDFETDFTQFTIMREEEDLGNKEGTTYTHIYRISELPYKMGTYLLEGKEYKQDRDDYAGANEEHIPTGTYLLPTGESLTFLVTKPYSWELFQYKKGDVVIEGTFLIAQDKKTIYLYISHDPYTKVTKADKEKYDTTFSIHYPPDFYLYGDFELKNDGIVVDRLYRHTENYTDIADSVWSFGTYTKE